MPRDYSDLFAFDSQGGPAASSAYSPSRRYADLTGGADREEPESEGFNLWDAAKSMVPRIAAPIAGGIAGAKYGALAGLPGGPAGSVLGGVIGAGLGGALGEYAGQKIEGVEDVDPGEVALAGGLSALPAGPAARIAARPGLSLLQRAGLHAAEGAAQGVLDVGAFTGYREGRLPTAGELGQGAVGGALIGGPLGAGLDSLARRGMRPNVDAPAARDAQDQPLSWDGIIPPSDAPLSVSDAPPVLTPRAPDTWFGEPLSQPEFTPPVNIPAEREFLRPNLGALADAETGRAFRESRQAAMFQPGDQLPPLPERAAPTFGEDQSPFFQTTPAPEPLAPRFPVGEDLPPLRPRGAPEYGDPADPFFTPDAQEPAGATRIDPVGAESRADGQFAQQPPRAAQEPVSPEVRQDARQDTELREAVDRYIEDNPNATPNELRSVIRQLREELDTDPLTGLGSARKWQRLKAEPVTEDTRFVALDLKGFKAVNDSMGHDLADEGLKSVAGLVRKHFGDEAFRSKGDEFEARLRGLPDADIGARIEAFREELRTMAPVQVQMPDGRVLALPTLEAHIASGRTPLEADLNVNAERQRAGSGRDLPPDGGNEPGTGGGPPSGGQDPPPQLGAGRVIRALTGDEARSEWSSARASGRHSDGLIPASDRVAREPRWVEVEVPLSRVNYDALDAEATSRYTGMKGDTAPPSVGTFSGRNKKLFLLDGNHRAAAAAARGETTIRVMMPEPDWSRYSTDASPSPQLGPGPKYATKRQSFDQWHQQKYGELPGPLTPDSRLAEYNAQFQRAPRRDPAKLVTEALLAENPRAASDGALVYVPNLRARMSRELPGDAFDREMVRLMGEGRIQLQPHPTPASLTPAQRAAMIFRPDSERLAGADQMAPDARKVFLEQSRGDSFDGRPPGIYYMAVGILDDAKFATGDKANPRRVTMDEFARERGISGLMDIDHSELSPNGRVSGRQRELAHQRGGDRLNAFLQAQKDYQAAIDRGEIIGDYPPTKTTPEAEKLLAQAAREREYAKMAGGAQAKKLLKRAEELEARAAAFGQQQKLRATDSPTAKGINTATVERAFPTGKVQALRDGEWSVNLPNGSEIRVRQTGEIAYRPEAFKAGYGREIGETEQIVGAWNKVDRNGLIQLAKMGADEGTLRHETFHAAMDLALTPKERAAVLAKYGDEETAAEAFARWTPMTPNSWFSKIVAFFRKIVNTFKPSADSAFGRVQSGEAFGKAAPPGDSGSKFGARERPSFPPGSPERDANFRRWFGQSKVVDEKGEPRVVYHGTRADFDTFRETKRKHNESGFFFSPDPKIASRYSGWDELFPADKIGGVKPVYLSINNPLVVDLKGSKHGRAEAIQRAKAEGYDGLHIVNHYDAGGIQDQWVAFRPEQIKSATGNRGTFDPDSPDIRFGTKEGVDSSPMSPKRGPGDRAAEPTTEPGGGPESYPAIASGDRVGGLVVGDGPIKNADSIASSLNDGEYSVLGVRRVPRSLFNSAPTDLFYAANDIARSERLAEEIRQSGRIDPLIVVYDGSEQSPYILEGAHRLAALHILDADEFPALVVDARPDSSSPPSRGEQPKYATAPKNPPGFIEDAPPLKAVPPAAGSPPNRPGEGFGQPGGDPDIAPNINRMNVSDAQRESAQAVIEPTQNGLRRERVETWEGLDEEVQKIQRTKSDEDLYRTVQRRQLDSAEVMALKQRVDQKARDFDDALESKDPKKIMERALDLAAGSRALANDGTATARALAARRRLMEPGANVTDTFMRKVWSEIPGISVNQGANLLAIYKTDPGRLPDAIQAALKPGKLKKFIEWWKAGLLSAPSTDMANIGGNALEMATNIVESAVSAGVDKMLSRRLGTTRQRFTGEAKHQIAGLLESFPDALSQLRRDMTDVFTLKQSPIDVSSDLSLERQAGAIGGKLGRAVRTSFGKLSAEDKFAKSIGSHMALRKLAYRKANGNENLAKKIVREVQSEGKHPELIEQAGEMAKAMVFQDDPSSAAKWLMGAAEQFPALDLVIPFKGTPDRLAARTIQRSPLGFVLGKNSTKAVAQRFKAGEATQGELADAIARPLIGTIALIGFAAAAKAGMMTGSGPTDEKQKSALRDSGWSPYSFKVPIGEGRFAYIPFNRFEPVSSLLGFAADMAEAGNEKEASDVFSKALNSLGSNLVSKSYLQALSEAAQVISKPDRAAANWVSQFGGSLVPNVLRRATTAIDPVVRDTKPERTGVAGLPERVVKTMASRIPGVSQTLPARRTMTGLEMERGGNALARFASPSIPTADREDRDVEALIASIGGDALPSTPRKELVVRGQTVKLTDPEYDVLTSGNRAARDRVERLMRDPMFMSLPDSEAEARVPGRSKEAHINRIFDQYRQLARRRVFAMPSFQRRATQQRAQ